MIFFKKIFFWSILLLVNLSFAQTAHTLNVETKIKKLPFGITEKVSSQMPEVAVALSGGGARGLAQIGVLRALRDFNIPIDIIAGTSMGSIVGGLFAAGYSLDQLDSIATNTDWDNLLSSDRETNRRELFVDQKITEDKAIFSLRLKGFSLVLPTSLNSGQKLSNFLNLLTFQAPIHVDSSFDELKKKYRAVCTNLITGQSIVLDRGSLSEAMRASSSVSFFLSPVKYDSLTLVDGGLVANIPVKIASEEGGDYVIAVNTTSELHPEGELSLPWEVADQVVSIPMRILNEGQLKLASNIITPDLDDVAINDFSNPDSLILKGYQAAIPAAGIIKLQLDSLFVKKLNTKEFFIHDVLIDKNSSTLELPYLEKYATQDSVSNYEILKDLNSIYKKGNYKSLKAEITQYKNYSRVKFIAVENPEVKKIEIEGVSLIDTSAVYSVLKNLIHQPYNPQKLVTKLIQALNIYRSKGYSLAEVSNVNFNEITGKIKIDFDEGKISAIKIEGNKYTYPSIITRELPLKAGDYFNYNAIKQGLTNLRSTNLFDEIFLNVKKNGNKNILMIDVQEKTASLLRVGFRLDNENKAQLSLDVVDENLFGTGTELGLLLFGGTRNRAYSIEHKSNRIFNTYLTYKINAFYKFDDIYTYDQDVFRGTSHFERKQDGEYRQIFYGGSVSIGTQVERFGNLIFEGKYQVDQVENLQFNFQSPYRENIVSLKASSTIDTQDRYPYPQRGFYFKGEYESAQTILGGEVGYTNINFNYKSYFTFNGVSTLSPRFELGFADKTLPLSEQYSLGGQNSFFGMRDNEFRGRQIFLASLEYRYELPFKIFFETYFKARYDLGYAWPDPQEIRFKDLRHGIGTGLSFDTPIGPADFSIGKSFLFVKDLPGNPLSFGDTFFYFSIGYYY